MSQETLFGWGTGLLEGPPAKLASTYFSEFIGQVA